MAHSYTLNKVILAKILLPRPCLVPFSQALADGRGPGVEKSLDAARTSAYATSSSVSRLVAYALVSARFGLARNQ